MSRLPGMAAPWRAEPEPYPLRYEPDGRSWTVREDLVDILERELLGPLGGPGEVLDSAPDAVYLVGRIAPVRLLPDGEVPSDAGSDDAPTDVGDDLDARDVNGVPVSAVDDGTASSEEDDGEEDEPPKRGLMIPASMGLRFQIPTDLESFTVLASWGTYAPLRSDSTDTTRLRRYQRTPVDIPVTIAVSELTPGHTSTFPLRGQVVLRVDRHDDVEDERRLIEVALCNDAETPRRIPVEMWLYQTQLSVEAPGGAAVFLPVSDPLEDTGFERDDELRRLRLQYRDRLEFAVGRTCSVDWQVAEGERRATRVWTTWLPRYEVAQTATNEIAGALLDMTALATATPKELRDGLSPIVDGYREWLDGEELRAEQLPEHLRDEARDAVSEARKVQRQLADGLEHLLADVEALRCFQFMNRVMADQRIHTEVAEHRAAHPQTSLAEARAAVRADKGPAAHSWRTFQLAFILMQLPLLTTPDAEYRSGSLAKAQLLFFPTGGGKTEAYLGLAAYAFAIRRRQGVLETADGPLDGRAGVTVLMRYTLRLLTAQQFQRAAALVCAAEVARSEDPTTWGDEPFRIGLWVGTDVSPKWFEEAAEQLTRVNSGHAHRLTVLQVQRCPWCGSPITAKQVRADPGRRRVFVYCSDDLGDCPFAEGGRSGEGLPVLTVDEEIYRLTPAFLIATVDKFARLAREGAAAALFGYVSKRCDRHGYVHPDYRYCDIKDGSKHPARNPLPAAAVHPATRLRPPDLVIQDELHLITGALGTTVGLFEVAVDTMATWRTSAGRLVRPLLVASTATVRNAPDHVRALYARGVTMFPPQVIDAGRTFFSRELSSSENSPGRRYLGISTTGVRLTTAEIRVAEILMAAGQLLLDRADRAADPYLTLVAYFSAIRELAGMARYMGDDIQTALAKGRPWSGLPKRWGTDYGSLYVAELTSRIASGDITKTLDQMAVAFEPRFDSTAGIAELRTLREANKPVPSRKMSPFDAVLATSMLQVGVDVTRLGLMLVVGQPKNTAEYVQATGRVGRDPQRPGLVVTLGNWARPRDLAHFEQFRHYHATFNAEVEALSVTPFSITAMERGLDSVLVSALRVRDATRADGLSPEGAAGRITEEYSLVTALIDTLVERVKQASDEDSAERARRRLLNRLDQWVERRRYLASVQKALVYERVWDEGRYGPLLNSPENVQAHADSKDVAPFVVANSMREVQPEINLLVSPVKENLVYIEPPGTPAWEMPTGRGGAS